MALPASAFMPPIYPVKYILNFEKRGLQPEPACASPTWVLCSIGPTAAFGLVPASRVRVNHTCISSFLIELILAGDVRLFKRTHS